MASTYTVKFNLDTKEGLLTDTTSYVSVVGLTGTCTYVDPAGTTHNITPTPIDIEAGERIIEFDLPVDANGDVLDSTLGNYVFTYTVSGIDNVNTYTYTEPSFVTPTLTISHDCNTSTLTSVDSSDYSLTGYSETWERLHTVIVPTDSSLSNTYETDDSSSIDNTVGVGANIWTGTYVSTVVVECTYTQTLDSLILFKTINGISAAHEVECDRCHCQTVRCLKNLWDRYVAASDTNYKQAQELRRKMFYIMGEWILYSSYTNCGEYDTADTHCNNIREMLESEDCVCGDSSGSQEIIPYITISGGGGSGTTTLITAGTGISVSAVTVGTTTTYTIGLNATINNLTDVTISSATDKQVLQYDAGSGKWINIKLPIGDLDNIDVTGAADGKMLIYNGGTGKWTSSDLYLTNLINVADGSSGSGEFLVSTGSATWGTQTTEEVQTLLEIGKYYYTDFTDRSYTSSPTTALSTTLSSGDFAVNEGIEIETFTEVTGNVSKSIRTLYVKIDSITVALADIIATIDCSIQTYTKIYFYTYGGSTYMKYFFRYDVSGVPGYMYAGGDVTNPQRMGTTLFALDADHPVTVTLESDNATAGDLVLRSFTIKHIR